MASDSDLEAYLTQLSKKTYSLKQDVHSSSNYSSQPSSTATNSEEELELSGAVREKHNISDITALSNKYGGHGYKRTQLQDRLSSLEQKYLKNAVSGKRLSDVEDQSSDEKSMVPQISKVKERSVKSLTKKEKAKFANVHERKHGENLAPQSYSNQGNGGDSDRRIVNIDSSIDEELARYLNETSLDGQDDEFGTKPNQKTRPTQMNNRSSDDISEELFNLNNIRTVDDILGHLSDENENVGISEAVDEDEEVHDDTESPGPLKDESFDLKKTETENQQFLFTQNAESPFFSKESRNVLMNSSENPLLSEELHGGSPQRRGSIVTQTPENIFYSSRRNSEIVFNFSRRNSAISLASQGEKLLRRKLSKHNLFKPDIRNVESEESLVETIAEIDAPQEISSDGSELYVAEEGEDSENFVTEASDKELSLTKKAHDSIKSKGNQNVKELEGKEEKDIEKNGRKSSTEKSARNHSSSSKNLKAKGKKIYISDKETTLNSDNVSTKKVKEHKVKKSSHHRRSKKKRRQHSSSDSSSESSSSSQMSTDTDLKQYHRRRSKRHRSKRRGKSYRNSWMDGPVLPPWWFPPHPAMYGSLRGIPQPSLLSTNLMTGYAASSNVATVDDLLRQQVALIRQFMESQQTLYHAYTAALISSHRYTSLRDTEEYIKKRKPPLTFNEAYKMVKEEMKSSKM